MSTRASMKKHHKLLVGTKGFSWWLPWHAPQKAPFTQPGTCYSRKLGWLGCRVYQEKAWHIPLSGELGPDGSVGGWECSPISASPAASDARRSMAPPSSETRPLLPKEDHRRGEAVAEGGMLDGVLDPLSSSLQCNASLSKGAEFQK